LKALKRAFSATGDGGGDFAKNEFGAGKENKNCKSNKQPKLDGFVSTRTIQKYHEISPEKDDIPSPKMSKVSALKKSIKLDEESFQINDFLSMKIMGQFNLGFIITLLGDDLFIVDQHATDEKYNFETLQKAKILESQKMVCPQALNLTPANESLLVENLDVFKRNGFEFTEESEVGKF
jgi:DNA mismatch repair ATPase MutL